MSLYLKIGILSIEFLKFLRLLLEISKSPNQNIFISELHRLKVFFLSRYLKHLILNKTFSKEFLHHLVANRAEIHICTK